MIERTSPPVAAVSAATTSGTEKRVSSKGTPASAATIPHARSAEPRRVSFDGMDGVATRRGYLKHTQERAKTTGDVSFRATKTRKGKAPVGSGAAVGTEYHWFFAPLSQSARKLDANRYQMHLEGLKWKVGFRPATSATWDYEWKKTGKTARQRMIGILAQALADLKADERLGAAPIEAPSLEGERKVAKRKPRARAAKAPSTRAGPEKARA